jgi:hypothetical protein
LRDRCHGTHPLPAEDKGMSVMSFDSTFRGRGGVLAQLVHLVCLVRLVFLVQ